MAINKITYVDKKNLNVDESIFDEFKVTSDDMNEIKSVVNENADFLGDLSNLKTNSKDSLVEAINEVTSNDTIPVGTISAFADADETDTLMSDWVLCDGRELSRINYSKLFSVIGTKFGGGDGSTTFNVPDLRGRVGVGLDENDTDFSEIGKKIGEKEHALLENEAPKGQRLTVNSGTELAVQDYLVIETASKHNNIQPSLVVKYYIKAFRSSTLVAQVKNTTTTSDQDTYSCDFINNLSGEKNLVTNGPEIRTGEKRNGKDVYMKEISTTVSTTSIKNVPLNLETTDILIDWDAFVMDDVPGNLRVKSGFFADSENFFSVHPNNNVMNIFLGSNSTWIIDKQLFIRIWFVKEN